MEMKEGQKVYITKYTITAGIEEDHVARLSSVRTFFQKHTREIPTHMSGRSKFVR